MQLHVGAALLHHFLFFSAFFLAHSTPPYNQPDIANGPSLQTLPHPQPRLTTSTMVHLGKVATDQDIKDSKLPELENLDIGAEDQNEITTSVYGSRFAAQDLPKHEMPDGEMPREMAYRLIKDDLTLDGNPTLK
jgi:hypothetical protein